MSERTALEGGGGVEMSNRQRLNWLRLARCDGVGPATFRDLINHFGTAEQALEALPDLGRRSGRRRPIRIPAAADIEREVAALHKFGGQLVCSGEPDYPPAMLAYDAAPMVMSVYGDAGTLRRPMVGIVGSRDASLASTRLTQTFAEAIGAAGYVIASGLAKGIDAAAHAASLRTGTLAAFAGGVNVAWPPQNEDLAKSIIDTGGIVVSEMPFGWKPRAKDFPRRNRIIAGVSLGVLVVEAALRSGSLITARLANEMGRVVFAVPGSPIDPRSAGTNRLIKEGASFVTDPDDVLAELRPMHERSAAPAVVRESAPAPLSEPDMSERERIVSSLNDAPVPVDEVVRFTGLAPAVVQLVLLELDLAGRIERHGGNRVSLA